MEIYIHCETTQFAVFPKEKNEKTIFYLGEQSMVINFCDKKEKVLDQTEISREDAINLAKIILRHNNYNI